MRAKEDVQWCIFVVVQHCVTRLALKKKTDGFRLLVQYSNMQSCVTIGVDSIDIYAAVDEILHYRDLTGFCSSM